MENETPKKRPLDLTAKKVEDVKVGEVLLTYGGRVEGIMEPPNEGTVRFLLKTGHLNAKATLKTTMTPKDFTKGLTVIVVRQAE